MTRLLFLILIIVFTSNPAWPQETAEFSSLAISSVGTDGEMLDFTVSTDQKYIAVANENKVIKLFDGRTGRFIKRFTGYHDQVVEIVLIRGDRLLSVGFDASLAIIDIQTEQVVKTLSLPNKTRCLDVNIPGTEAVVGDNQGMIHFIDLQAMQVIKQKQTEYPQITSVLYSPDNNLLAVGTGVAIGYMIKVNPILLFDPRKREMISTLEGSQGSTTSLRFSQDGQWLYSGHKANSRSIKKWDMTSRAGTLITNTTNFISNSGYNGLDVNADNTVIIATTDDRSVEIYDLITGQQISQKSRTKIRMARKLDHFPRITFALNGGKDFIIGGFNQNLLYIFSSVKRGVTGYIHSVNDDWAVVSADGRMDGSLPAIQNLSWFAGLERIPLENTFDQSFTPRLLEQLIAEVEVRAEIDVKKVVASAPAIQLVKVNSATVPAQTKGAFKTTSAQKNITAEVRITENANLVQEVKLFQNSKLVSTKTPAGSGNLVFDIVLTDAFGPENFFYVTATSTNGLDAQKKNFVVEYSGKTNEAPRLFLFTVGLNAYKNPKYNLNYAQADANEFEKTIKAGATGLYQEVKIFNLRDAKATRVEILKQFELIRAAAKEQDVVIFYYAGHGVMTEEEPKDFHLVPHDVTQLYGQDATLKQKALSATELKTIAKDINAQKQVYILDACQSAGALDVLARGAAEEKALAQLARSTGTFWITATGSQQFATEFKDLGHGVFTYSLLEGLSGKADNGDKRITIKELSAYVEARVPELSEKYNGSPQYPSGYSFGNDFPISMVKE